MEHVMGISMVMFCVFTSLVTSITVSSNGNSPEIKMIGGLMVDTLKRQVTVKPTTQESANLPEQKSQQLEPLLTKLAINERYRRLIPYITFYYANDLTTPRVEKEKTVEVEKAELLEADEYTESNQRQPKKIINSPSRIIPRYQGNRLTQFNIASANPIKVFYKDGVPLYHNSNRVTTNFNPLLQEHVLINNDYNTGRVISKSTVKPHPVPVISPSRKAYLNAHRPEDTSTVQYYVSEKETPPKYKLIPYEQTPPVRVVQQNNNVYETKRPYIVSVSIPREEVYIKPKPTRPQYFYDSINNTPSAFKKQPSITPETFYEKQSLSAPVLIEDGFKPILNPNEPYTTKLLDYATTTPQTYVANSERKEQNTFVETSPDESVTKNKQNIYQYIVEDHTYKPVEYTRPNAVNLAALLNSLQQNQSIPKLITRENVGSSIRTLLQALNALNAAPKEMYHQSAMLNTPKPFTSSKNVIDTTLTDKQLTSTPAPDHYKTEDIYIPDEPYLAAVKNPSQHIDDFQPGEGTIQHFPLPITSDEEGGTPGRPGIDYPTLTTIPQTVFDCKTQRYKGFFADPETRCQVWHYCDLNGGQASFLCPNGTIFSQAGLTCDWWFNVRCASTTQLYVLNESLYKYILPHKPKFPEDFSGPLVDKYLTLKFKEMEEEFKKNKNKQTKTDKVESEDSDEKESDKKNEQEESNSQNTVSEASVIVESVGASGKVARLHDE